MVCLSDSRRSSSLCSMYCASLTLAQTCNCCLCLTSIRETKPCPLDNLYTAAAFPSELPRTWSSCFVSLAVLRTTDSDPVIVLAAGITLSPCSLLPSRHPVGSGRENITSSTSGWETGPTWHGKSCRKGSAWKRLYGLSSALLLVINEIMWDYAKRQQDGASCVILQKGLVINITERN